MEKTVKDGKPFFVWHNPSRMHIYTHLREANQKLAAPHTSEIDIYGSGMMELDAQVGQILDKLEELGVADNTIVAFTADNGPMVAWFPDAGTTPFRGEKATTWEGGLRVPMLIRWPARIKPGSVSNGIQTNEDLFVTLAAAAGVPDVAKQLLESHKVKIDGINNLAHWTEVPLRTGTSSSTTTRANSPRSGSGTGNPTCSSARASSTTTSRAPCSSTCAWTLRDPRHASFAVHGDEAGHRLGRPDPGRPRRTLPVAPGIPAAPERRHAQARRRVTDGPCEHETVLSPAPAGSGTDLRRGGSLFPSPSAAPGPAWFSEEGPFDFSIEGSVQGAWNSHAFWGLAQTFSPASGYPTQHRWLESYVKPGFTFESDPIRSLTWFGGAAVVGSGRPESMSSSPGMSRRSLRSRPIWDSASRIRRVALASSCPADSSPTRSETSFSSPSAPGTDSSGGASRSSPSARGRWPHSPR